MVCWRRPRPDDQGAAVAGIGEQPLGLCSLWQPPVAFNKQNEGLPELKILQNHADHGHLGLMLQALQAPKAGRHRWIWQLDDFTLPTRGFRNKPAMRSLRCQRMSTEYRSSKMQKGAHLKKDRKPRAFENQNRRLDGISEVTLGCRCFTLSS